MRRSISRPVLTGLALAVLPLALACGPVETEAACKDPNRNRTEAEVVHEAMERAIKQVDFGFCRNQKCLVEVSGPSECDTPSVVACITRHIVAANGLPVTQPAEATLKLSATIVMMEVEHQQRIWTQDVDYGRFRGQLTATGSGPAGANRVVKLEGRAQKADL
jgi:hypothetical protein